MFKNLSVYRMTKHWSISALDLEIALGLYVQNPIGLSQEVSTGWTEIINSQFCRDIDGQLLIAMKTEKKRVPSSALKAALSEKVAAVTDSTGRKPGKKETRELADEVRFELLPKVLPVTSVTQVWIDTKGGWIVVNSASKSVTDTVMSLLVKTVDKLQLETLYLAKDAGTVMTEWLASDIPDAAFSIDRACELKSCDESKTTVKYANAHLDTDDIRTHLKQGKRVTKLALTWSDRVSFTLADDFRIRKLQFLDTVMEDHGSDHDDQQAADIALMTGELRVLLSDLIQAFGGMAAREEGTK